jgi:hypothetical protein
MNQRQRKIIIRAGFTVNAIATNTTVAYACTDADPWKGEGGMVIGVITPSEET